MIDIRVELPKNMSDIISTLPARTQQIISLSVNQTLMATRAKWIDIAQRKLTTTFADYVIGLNTDGSVNFPDPFTGILTLKGKWQNMLETGFPAFDMKGDTGVGGFANSAKRKMIKRKDGTTGWYLTIPFRHRTPGTSGIAVQGQAMPNDIYSQAKLLTNGQRLTGTETAYSAQVSWKGYQHVNGIYEGMVKNQKLYNQAVQSSYFTFRRVSDKSDPNSWWHPGFSGVKALDVLEPWVRATFDKVLEKNLRGK